MQTKRVLFSVLFNPGNAYVEKTLIESVVDDSGNQVGGNKIVTDVVDGSTVAGKAEIAAYYAAAGTHSKPSLDAVVGAAVTLPDAVKVVTDREAERAAERQRIADAEAAAAAALEAIEP